MTRRSPAVGLSDLTSTGIADVTNTTPSTSAFALAVRLVGGAASVIVSSSQLLAAASTVVRVTNSTAQRVPVQATVEGTIPVSGTITANLGTIDGAATEATLTTILSSVDGLEVLTRDVKRAITDLEARLDYSTRLDGNPVYIGKHLNGTSTNSTSWTVQKLSYDTLNRLTRAQVLSGSWANRASLGW